MKSLIDKISALGKHKVTVGISWLTLSSLVVISCQILQLVLLARILTPVEFGAATLLTIFIGIAQVFSDGGTSGAIIQKQKPSNSQLSSVYWFGVLLCFAISVLLIFLSTSIALFFGTPSLDTPIEIVAATIILSPFGTHYRALYQKKLAFALPAIVDIVAVLCRLFLTITLAKNGFGVLSVAYGYILFSIIECSALTYFGRKHHYKPSFSLNFKVIQAYIHFGIFDLGNRITSFIVSSIDKVLLGRYGNIQSVGFYNLASQFATLPTAKLYPIVHKIAFPVYASQQGSKSIRNRSYTITVNLLMLLAIPILSFLAFFSNEFIFVVYGAEKTEPARILNILAYVGILRTVGNPGGNLLMAQGNADICFWWNCFLLASLTVFIYIGMTISADAITLSLSILTASLTVGSLWHLVIIRFAKIDYSPILVQFITVFGLSQLTAFAISELDLIDIGYPVLNLMLSFGIYTVLFSLLYLCLRAIYSNSVR